MLEVRQLAKHYKRREVVSDVSFQVARGDIVGLLGPNGAGKTTTFNMIVGIVQPDAGRIFINGKDVTDLPMFRRARLGIGYLPQEPSIFRRLTVRENLMAILETLPISRMEREKRMEALLEEFGVDHVAGEKGYTLSGGERRRVEISRALVTEPSLLLLDEPFAGIDPIAVQDIQEMVTRLRDRGLGILITDHNVRETLSITDRAYIMFEGRVLLSGTARDLAENPEAREIYLGDRFRL
ncbi:MAG: LPS export ABC transporter ATP-binding protein [bacterium]